MVLLLAGQAQAGEWLLGIGYDRGGDQLGTAVDVNTGNRQTVRTNEGPEFSVGRVYCNDAAKQFETLVSIGYKNGGPIGKDGEVSFTSWPVTVMEFYRPNAIRLGAGLVYGLRPQYTTQGIGIPKTVNKIDNALGLMAQIGWAPIGQQYSIDLRYTSIKYQPELLNRKLDGSTFGISASGRF